jgi:Uma2 family endonuclease
MSLIKRSVQPSVVPPLQNGDRLTRAEFERRYDATPGLKNAELIEGRVYMAPPVSHLNHSVPHADLVTWLGLFRAATPGVSGGDNGSLRLDLDNMPQPDAYLLIAADCGGQARIDADGYVAGAPELVAEVAASTVSYDLHDKLNVYRRNGVREYIVWRTSENAVDQFILRGSDYVRVAADAQGMMRSEIFPGLWLDTTALRRGDLTKVLQYLQEGISTPEHATFVQKLAAARH